MHCLSAKIVDLMSQHNNISMCWIPAHCGYIDNELADAVAEASIVWGTPVSYLNNMSHKKSTNNIILWALLSINPTTQAFLPNLHNS